MFKYKYLGLIIILVFTAAFLAGCATQVSHFRLDTSLQKGLKTFGGTEYISLAKVCDFYGLDYRYDGFARTATIRKGSNLIVVRAEGDG